MTEQEVLGLQLAAKYPEDKELWQDSLNKYGVNGTLDRLRKKNADNKIGELDCQFIEWIKDKEVDFINEIRKHLADSSTGLNIGNKKIKFTYYGMIFTILTWEGCYVMGKNKQNAPNRISCQKFCDVLLNLKDRLNSGNVRKTIASQTYSYNYYLDIASEEAGRKDNHLPDYAQSLRPVFKNLVHEIRQKLLLRE